MIRVKFDFGIFYLETSEFELNHTEAERAIARIQAAIAATEDGQTKKKRFRISIQTLHQIRKIVERNPRITYKELAIITEFPISTLKNSKKVRAIFNNEKGSREREAKKRYIDSTTDSYNDRDNDRK